MAKLTEQEIERQVALLMRGCEAIYTQQELAKRLALAAEENRPPEGNPVQEKKKTQSQQ